MAMRFKLLAVAGAGACLAACSTTPVDPGLGEALKYDMAIQTINPDPVYPAEGMQPGALGTTAAAAAERYRKGTVKQIERVSASRANSSSGSGSGSGSGPR